MWIKCDERLPKEGNHVFIRLYDGDILLAYLTHKYMTDEWYVPEGQHFKIINGGRIITEAVLEWYEL